MGVKHTPMASAGARAHSGGLGAKPPAAVSEVFVFKTVISNTSAAVLHEMVYCFICFFCKVSKFIVSALK